MINLVTVAWAIKSCKITLIVLTISLCDYQESSCTVFYKVWSFTYLFGYFKLL